MTERDWRTIPDDLIEDAIRMEYPERPPAVPAQAAPEAHGGRDRARVRGMWAAAMARAAAAAHPIPRPLPRPAAGTARTARTARPMRPKTET